MLSNNDNSNKPIITFEELEKHRSRGDCWVLIKNRIYDLTCFLQEHPGGSEILLVNSGKDATQEFTTKGDGEGHSKNAWSLFEQFWIGNLAHNPERSNKSTIISRKYTYEEIAKHNQEEDCWVIIEGKVYDVTNYMYKHPGGHLLFLDYAGNDATLVFNSPPHSTDALVEMRKYEVGDVDHLSYQVQKKPGVKRKEVLNPASIMFLIGLIFTLFCYFIH